MAKQWMIYAIVLCFAGFAEIARTSGQKVLVDSGAELPDAIATLLNPEENPIFAKALHNLSFSPNGQWLATGQGSGNVLLWDTDEWKQAHTIEAHDNWAFSVVFSTDSTLLWTGGGDNTIKAWQMNLLSQPVKTLLNHEMDVHALALSPGDKHLVSAGDDLIPIVWDLSTDQPLRRLAKHPRQITAVAIDPGGQTIATACRDSRVRLFDFHSGEIQFTLAGHDKDVMSVRFSPSGQMIASAGYDGTVCLWDVDMGYLIERLTNHEGAAVCVDFSPDGKEIVSVDHRRLTFLKSDDLKAAQRFLEPELAEGEQMSFVRYSPDGKWLAVTTTEARILLIDAAAKQVVRELVDNTPPGAAGRPAPVSKTRERKKQR